MQALRTEQIESGLYLFLGDTRYGALASPSSNSRRIGEYVSADETGLLQRVSIEGKTLELFERMYEDEIQFVPVREVDDLFRLVSLVKHQSKKYALRASSAGYEKFWDFYVLNEVTEGSEWTVADAIVAPNWYPEESTAVLDGLWSESETAKSILLEAIEKDLSRKHHLIRICRARFAILEETEFYLSRGYSEFQIDFPASRGRTLAKLLR